MILYIKTSNKFKLSFIIVGIIIFVVVIFMTNFFVVTAETTVDTSTRVITLSDKDGDGILDINDPHPKIAEIYIVEDNNLNGIVDYFEEKNNTESDKLNIQKDYSENNIKKEIDEYE